MKKLLNLILLLIFIISLAGCKDDEPEPIYDNVIFDIFGEDEVVITKGDVYSDIGYIAKDSGVDIKDFVSVVNPVDTALPGEYDITFTLDYHDVITVLTRRVIVLYENDACNIIPDTTTMDCYKNWSNYLHTVVTLRIYFDQYSIINSEEIFYNIEEIIALYNIISDKYTAYEGYVNVNTINAAPTETHTISQELFDLIKFTLDHQAEVDNLFNAALGPVLQIWHNYREDCQLNNVCEVPSLSSLQDAAQYTNPDNIILDEENLTITMGENMSLDLGGVSKGYISGFIIEYLDSLNIDSYLLNNGTSNVSVGGTHPTRESGKYILAVTDPTYAYEYYAKLYIEDGEQLVTSGDYQQYYVADGEVYHHIIHNETLMPERNSRSVSVVYSDPGLADLYSTAIFLMTIEDGIEFVDGVDGLEAIWFDMNGNIQYSANFEEDYVIETYTVN